MLTTNNRNFGIEIQDTTVSILPGVARVGNALMSFPGAVTTFDRLYTAGSDASSRFQNVLLYIQDAFGVPDMTKVISQASTYADLMPAYMGDSSSYAPGYPLSMLTFDGSSSQGISLLSYTVP